jgi:hypothetical protein
VRLLLLLALVGCQVDPHVSNVRTGKWCHAEFRDQRPHIFSGSDDFLLDTGATSTWLPDGRDCPADGEIDLCAVVVGASMCASPGLDSIVGGGTLEGLALSFDPAGSQWSVNNRWETSTDLHLGCTLPFIDTAPGGRAFVNINIEGTTGEFLVDTGGVFIMLRKTQFDRLVADGRGSQPIKFNTAYGQRDGAFSYSAGVTPCGIDAQRTLTIATGIDDILDQIAMPSGKPLAGTIGGSYLFGARSVIDYPGGEVRIYFKDR